MKRAGNCRAHVASPASQAFQPVPDDFIRKRLNKMDNQQLQFDKTYWASQPSEVRSLPGIDDFDARIKRGAELAVKGFTIDVPIMVWGWDPYLVMKQRAEFGYVWVPSALGPPVTIAPGLTAFPGVVAYDPAHPPAGSIHVSTRLEDYPPFDPPAPPPPPANNDPVGIQMLGVLYYSIPGESHADGDKFTDPRGTFLKHVVLTPFGRSNYWEKIA